MEELNDNFHFVYSCSLMHRIQIKIGTLEGNRQKPEYDKLLEDPLLKYSGLCQDGYADLKVECVVYDAGQPLALPVTTSHKGFSSRWSWNEWLTLPIQYSDLPRTAQLALTIYDCVGPDKMYPVGGTTIRLFSKHGLFRQGMVDLRVFPNRKADGSDKTETPGKTKDNGKDQRQRLTKLTKKHRNSHMTKVDWLDRLAFRELGQIIAAEKDASEYMYLMIEFPKLYVDSIEHHVVYFEQSGEELFSFRSHTDIVTVPDQEILRENLVERKHHKLARSLRSGHCDKDAKPNATIRDILNTIVSYPSTKPLSNEEQDHVWKFRFYLSNQKKALTKFLKCVNWTQQNEVRQALAMMKIWAPMDVEDALELLSPNFTHPAVRRYAISRLQKASDEDIFLYMLQLVQALKYESFKDIQEAYARISPGREQPLSSAALITLNEEKEREAATLAAAAAAAAAANATQASQQQTGSPHLEKKDSKESNTSTITNESQQFAMHRSSTSSNFSYNSYGTTTTGSNNNLNQTIVSSSASPVGGLNSDRTSSNVNSVIENYGRRESGGGDLSDGDLLPMSTTRGSTTSLPQLSMAPVTDANDINTTTALPNLIGRNNNAYTDSGNTETLQDYVNNDIINEEEDENVQDLATFLIYRACKNSNLANYFYWYLSIECEDQEPTIKENVVVREMYMTVMKTFSQALVKGTPEMQKRRVFLSQQQHFINNLVKLVKNVLRESGNRKKKAEKLQQLLSDPSAKYNFSSFEPFPFPLDPDVTIKGIIPEKASLFKSALMPSKLHFVTSDNTEYLAIFKHGDDLRQDQLILQMITLMDRLLRKENLDLKLTPYRVLATSTKHGFVQFIDSVSVAEAVAAEGSIHNYFRKHHPQETGPYGIAPDIMDTYVRSCAGYCVITYLLGVGDRHLDNLLLTPCGKLFHIDFGYILGRDPKPLPPPMKLSKEMVEAMGGVNSEHYQEFRKQCYTAFLHLRRHANLMLNLFSLMVDASVPDIALEPDKAVRKVQDKFRLDLGEEEAVHYIQYLIDSSVTAVMPAIVEQIHKFTQYIRK